MFDVSGTCLSEAPVYTYVRPLSDRTCLLGSSEGPECVAVLGGEGKLSNVRSIRAGESVRNSSPSGQGLGLRSERSMFVLVTGGSWVTERITLETATRCCLPQKDDGLPRWLTWSSPRPATAPPPQ